MLKVLKFVSFISLLFFLFQVYGYVNLEVSQKFETDDTLIRLSDLSDEEKREELKNIEYRYLEIQDQKKSMVIRGVIFLMFFLVIRVLIFRFSPS